MMPDGWRDRQTVGKKDKEMGSQPKKTLLTGNFLGKL